MKAEEVVRWLGLEPHPKGGYFREIYRAPGEGRTAATSIYFLLEAGPSRWHPVDAPEIWAFHAGAPLTRISHQGHGLRRCPGVRSARSGPKSVAQPTVEARDAAGGRLGATRRAALSGRQGASSRLPDASHRAARLSYPAGPTAPRRP